MLSHVKLSEERHYDHKWSLKVIMASRFYEKSTNQTRKSENDSHYEILKSYGRSYRNHGFTI